MNIMNTLHYSCQKTSTLKEEDWSWSLTMPAIIQPSTRPCQVKEDKMSERQRFERQLWNPEGAAQTSPQLMGIYMGYNKVISRPWVSMWNWLKFCCTWRYCTVCIYFCTGFWKTQRLVVVTEFLYRMAEGWIMINHVINSIVFKIQMYSICIINVKNIAPLFLFPTSESVHWVLAQ